MSINKFRGTKRSREEAPALPQEAARIRNIPATRAALAGIRIDDHLAGSVPPTAVRHGFTFEQALPIALDNHSFTQQRFIAAIDYATDPKTDGGIEFLNAWKHGEHIVIKENWPDFDLLPDLKHMGFSK